MFNIKTIEYLNSMCYYRITKNIERGNALYPFKMQPVYKDYIWGGNKICKRFAREVSLDRIAESWEISCHDNGMSIILNGRFKGNTLKEILNRYPSDILGNDVIKNGIKEFPMLIKILDAEDKLSVQVHPNDEYAHKNENGQFGKTEMWYVVDAKPGAKLVYGVKPGTTKEAFREELEKGQVEKYLNFVDVEPGDSFFIPAGTIHAICDGILIIEIQQSSDLTYRVYDWGRVGDDGQPRQLHIEKALEVIDFSDITGKEKVIGKAVKEGNNIRTTLADCEYFITEKVEIEETYKIKTNNRFNAIIFIDGQGKIKHQNGEEAFKEGDAFFIPAGLKDYEIIGKCSLIKSGVCL